MNGFVNAVNTTTQYLSKLLNGSSGLNIALYVADAYFGLISSLGTMITETCRVKIVDGLYNYL